MEIPNITYYDFIRLDNDEQFNWINILRYGDPIEVDCTTWKYGDVKTVQQLLTKELTEEGFDYILSLVFTKGYMYIPFHIVLLTYRGIIEGIERVTKIENDSLVSIPDGKVAAALEKVGGFEVFGRLPELLSLVEAGHGTYQQVYDLEWSLAYSIQLYLKRCNEFKLEISKQ